MYKYLNVHPEGKLVGDCVKRAITVATGFPYESISLALNRYKKKTGAKTYNEWHKTVVPFMEEDLEQKRKVFQQLRV